MKIYFRNKIITDEGKTVIVRGYYHKYAPYVYKQKVFSY